MVLKKNFFIFLTLVLFFSCTHSLKVKAIESQSENDYVIKDKTILTLHFSPYILKGEVAKLVKDSSLPFFLVQRELKLSQSVKNYLLANSQILNLNIFYFLDSDISKNKNLEFENLKNSIVKDQDGEALSFSVGRNNFYTTKINFKIKILPSTETIFLTYRSNEMFENRGMVNNVYIKKDQVTAENPLVIKTEIELKAIPFHPNNRLVFSSLTPDKIEDLPFEYDSKQPDGKKYTFSNKSLQDHFKTNSYFSMQFGSKQVYDFEIKLFIPANPSSKKIGLLSSISRIPVVLRLPTSSIDTFINYSSHKPRAWLYDYSGHNELLFLIPDSKDQEIILKGRSQIFPINLNLDETYKKRYQAATMDQYPKYQIDSLKKETESFDPEILAAAKTIKGDKTKVSEIIKATYDFVVKNINYDWISYDQVVNTDYYEEQPALVTLTKGSGICGDYSRLMIALLKAIGIPAESVSGTVDVPYSGNKFPWHAWVQVDIPHEAKLEVDPTWGESGRDYISQDFDHLPFSYESNRSLYRFPSSFIDDLRLKLSNKLKYSMVFKPSSNLPGDKDLLLDKKVKNHFFIDNFSKKYDPITTILPNKIKIKDLPLVLMMFFTDPKTLQVINDFIWLIILITIIILVVFFLIKLLVGLVKLIIRKIFIRKKALGEK